MRDFVVEKSSATPKGSSFCVSYKLNKRIALKSVTGNFANFFAWNLGVSALSRIHMAHIKAYLSREFDGLIDLSDAVRENDKNNKFLTRALAAFVLSKLTSCSPKEAVQSIVDGYKDNGIDSVYFDEEKKNLWIIQSKWIHSGIGQPENGDVKKFVAGVRDLIDFSLERFGKLANKKDLLLKALEDTSVKLKIVLAYPGGPLSDISQRDLEDLVNELNDPSEYATYTVLTQSDIHKLVTREADGSPIDIEIALINWGKVEHPYTAFYGQICAQDIAVWWEKYGDNLFARNIRKFIGTSDANQEMIRTLKTSPERFWYYNNGVTVLCKKIAKKPLGGSDRDKGFFVCEGVTIVNGAQTVGTIGLVAESHSSSLASAMVPVRFISLENCPDNFDIEVTKATNTQNRIEKRDFVSLDTEQERLRFELSLIGKSYLLKRGRTGTSSVESEIDVEEATIALACAYHDPTLAVQAKREIGKLWEDITSTPYRLLFNGKLTGQRLWRIVQIQRIIDVCIQSKLSEWSGKARSVVIHGNRIIAHLVFSKLDLVSEIILDEEAFQTKVATVIPEIVDQTCHKLVLAVERLFPKSYVNSLFKNVNKCRALIEDVNKNTSVFPVQTTFVTQWFTKSDE